VVELIGRIQPSKLTIAAISDITRSILLQFYPEDHKFALRNEAKGKKILIINKLSTEEEFELISVIEREICKFKRYILLREAQLGSVLFLEDNRKKYSAAELQQVYVDSYS
jgi:hypothetical protein